MKAFSELEQKLTLKMIEFDEKETLNVLANILNSLYGEDHLPEDCYVQIGSQNDISIQVTDEAYNEKGTDWIRSIGKDIVKKLLTIVLLFEYLESQKLAYFVGDLDLKYLGNKYVDCKYHRCDFIDEELMPSIYKYARKQIYISETLRILAKNGFKTDEELHYERELAASNKQLKFTRYALAFTIVGLVISVIVPVFVTSSVDLKNKQIVTEISSSSIKGINDGVLAEAISINLQLLKISTEMELISKEIANLHKTSRTKRGRSKN